MLVCPSSASMRSSVRRARLRTDVKATSKRRPCALSLRPALSASVMPCSVRSGSFQPVKRFFRFHSLWPWRTSTRRRSLISCPFKFLEITKPEHIGHRIEAGLLITRPECRLDGALREHGAVLGAMRQFDALHGTRKNHAVVAGDGAAAQRGKTDIA